MVEVMADAQGLGTGRPIIKVYQRADGAMPDMEMPTMSVCKKRSVRRGFTLLEMMVVLVIIGLLAGVVAINLVGQADSAKATTTRQKMVTIQGAIDGFYVQQSRYPVSLAELVQMNMVVQSKLQDAWKEPIYYMSPAANGSAYVLISFGKNKQDDGGAGDDIYVYPEAE